MSVYAPPPAPSSIKEAGVGHKLLFDLLLKLMHAEGLDIVSMLAARTRLPVALISDLIEEARELALVESLGARGRDFSAEGLEFNRTMFTLFDTRSAARFIERYAEGFSAIDFRRYSKAANPKLVRYDFDFGQFLR